MAGRGGAETAPGLQYGRGVPVSAQACGRRASPFAQAPGWGVPFFAQASGCGERRCASLCAGAQPGARSRVPRGALGHKGLKGKHGARPKSVERLQAVGDLERILGSGAGLAGTASLAPPYAPFPSSPLTAFPCSNGLAGRRGARWEDEILHLPSCVVMVAAGSVSQALGIRQPPGQLVPLPS